MQCSPEAPVPVVEVKDESARQGGAGNVCRNLREPGRGAGPGGGRGPGRGGPLDQGERFRQPGHFPDAGRPTTVKTRIIAQHQQVVRVDKEKRIPVSSVLEERILDFIRGEDCRGIILSDYNKGILTPDLCWPTSCPTPTSEGDHGLRRSQGRAISGSSRR